MKTQDRLNDYFNPAQPTILHIDLNSCFATVEQQANPLLRNRPIAVAAYTSPNGCVLAPSIEAKRFGCKTGMRVKDCQQLCPGLIVLSPDSQKYRYVHIKLKQILSGYTDKLLPKSVDEFVLDLSNTPAMKRGLTETSREIKQRIRQELGDYLTVSIGLAPNRTLAKLAAGLQKPDGLVMIDKSNYLNIYEKIDLLDLPGINVGYKTRLARVEIYSVIDLFSNSLSSLHKGFKSVVGSDWFSRLRGWEVDAVEWGRKSFSNTHSIKVAVIREDDIFPIMTNLNWKTTSRMRAAGFFCYGVQLGFRYRNGEHAFDHTHSAQPLFSSVDIFNKLKKLFYRMPRDYVSKVDVGVYDLCSSAELQLSCLDDAEKTSELYRAIDAIEHAWGRNTIHPARMLPAKHLVLNRLPFGGGKEMEQYVFNGEEI